MFSTNDRQFHAVSPDERLAWRQIDQRTNRLTRALHRSKLEPLRDGEQTHHGGGLEPFAQHQGARNRHDHQRVDVQRPRSNSCNGPARWKDPADRRCDRECHSRRGVAARKRQSAADRKSRCRRDHEPPSPREGGSTGGRLLVLEPHPHARLAGGVHDGRRRELGSVVLDMQPLSDEISRHRLESRERLQPALEDDDLFSTVHALDAKHGFRMKLANRARGCLAGRHRRSQRSRADHRPQSNVELWMGRCCRSIRGWATIVGWTVA